MSKHRNRVLSPRIKALRNLEGAFWMIGLAVLFFKGWFWPGILVLVALSAVFESVLTLIAPEVMDEETNAENDMPTPPTPPMPPIAPAVKVETPVVYPTASLPTNCPRCGAPARGHEVHWTSIHSADCAFCGANLPLSK
jgi:hypothetical protein